MCRIVVMTLYMYIPVYVWIYLLLYIVLSMCYLVPSFSVWCIIVLHCLLFILHQRSLFSYESQGKPPQCLIRHTYPKQAKGRATRVPSLESYTICLDGVRALTVIKLLSLSLTHTHTHTTHPFSLPSVSLSPQVTQLVKR